jgi:hypothetical protein
VFDGSPFSRNTPPLLSRSAGLPLTPEQLHCTSPPTKGSYLERGGEVKKGEVRRGGER